MGNVLTSTLIIKGEDQLSKPARSSAQALRSTTQALRDAEKRALEMSKAMAKAGATDRFATSLSRLKLSAADVKAVTASWSDYAKTQGLAAKASDWTKAQIANVRAWERQTIVSLREVKREQQAFYRSLGVSPLAVSPMMAAMSQNSMANARLTSGMSAAGARGLLTPGGAAAMGAMAGRFGGVLPIAGGFIGYEAVRKALEAANERQHVITGARLAGMRPGELSRAEAAAAKAVSGAPNMSVSETLELFKEGRSAVQHPEEMFHLIGPLAKAASVLKGMGVENANLADIVKGGESLGLMNDPKRFRAYLEGQVKAMQVMGKTITTEQVYEAAKYSKSAGATLSDEFLNTTLPSLIQEMHGSSAGDALAMLTRTLRGGLQKKHMPVQLLNKLGLLSDPSKIRRAKGSGEIMGYMGKVKGDELLASDPGRWFTQIFKPAAEKGGYKTLSDQVRLLNQVLPSTAANLGRILIQQEETLKAHRKLYQDSLSLDEAVEAQKSDPKSAIKELSAAFEDFSAAALQAVPVSSVLHKLAEALRVLTKVAGLVSDRIPFMNRDPKAAAREAELEKKAHAWWRSMGVNMPWWGDDGSEGGESKEQGGGNEGGHTDPTKISAEELKKQKEQSSDFWTDFWKKGGKIWREMFGVGEAHAEAYPGSPADLIRNGVSPGYGRRMLFGRSGGQGGAGAGAAGDFDPTAGGGPNGGFTGGRGSAGAASRSAMMGYAMDQLRREGVPEQHLRAAAANLVGQADMESGLNPNLVHDQGTGFGIYGARLGRRSKMFAWLAAHGYARNSSEGQMRYMAHEAMTGGFRRTRAALMSGAYGAGVTNAITGEFESPAVINARHGAVSRAYSAGPDDVYYRHPAAKPSEKSGAEVGGVSRPHVDASSLRQYNEELERSIRLQDAFHAGHSRQSRKLDSFGKTMRTQFATGGVKGE